MTVGILDNPLRGVAKTLHQKFGKAITYRRLSASAYNITTGKVAQTASDETITAVIAAFDSREVGGTVQAGDLRVTVAATDGGLTAAPALKDRIVIDSTSYEIIRVTPTYSGDQVALYELQVRR